MFVICFKRCVVTKHWATFKERGGELEGNWNARIFNFSYNWPVMSAIMDNIDVKCQFLVMLGSGNNVDNFWHRFFVPNIIKSHFQMNVSFEKHDPIHKFIILKSFAFYSSNILLQMLGWKCSLIRRLHF